MPYFINKHKQKIAYKTVKGRGLGIIFIHGLNSDMNGQKALSLERYARKNNLNFIRFDCRGHGKSHGKFENFTISDWKKDLIDIIDNISRGPQILVGSSMGGWLMFLAARARPKKIKGLVGIATAVDFGNDLYSSLSKNKKKQLSKKGIVKYTSYGFSYYIKKQFFIDAVKNNVLIKKINFNKPVILIHGLKDDVVSKKTPELILNNISSNHVKIIYIKNSDHRLSSLNDLNTIKKSIELIRAN